MVALPFDLQEPVVDDRRANFLSKLLGRWWRAARKPLRQSIDDPDRNLELPSQRFLFLGREVGQPSGIRVHQSANLNHGVVGDRYGG